MEINAANITNNSTLCILTIFLLILYFTFNYFWMFLLQLSFISDWSLQLDIRIFRFSSVNLLHNLGLTSLRKTNQ